MNEVDHYKTRLATALAIGEATDRELVDCVLVLTKIRRNVKKAVFLIERNHVATALRVLREIDQ